MAIEIDIFKAIDVVADKLQNNSPLDKDAAEKIVVEYDIVYDESDPKSCVMDTYRIPRTDGKYPALFYIHGGGFVAGDKRYRRGVSKWYAQTGIYVFNVNYGLCPDYKYPQPLVHLIKAMNYIVERADEFNIDLSKFFVSGDSAGAYYAAMMIAACNNKNVREKLGVETLTNFKAAVFNCGLYDIRSILEAKIMFDVNTKIFRGFTGMEKADFDNYIYQDLCSPIACVDEKFPPVFLAYSKKDILCHGQAERLIEALEKCGVYYDSYCANLFLANHCFPLAWKGKNASKANKLTSEFVAKFIKGELPQRAIKK